MTGLEVAVIASATMVATDIVSTVQIMASARNRGWLAGWLDTAGWLVAITTTTLTVTALQGSSFSEKAWVIVLVSAANLFGTKLGQVIGTKYVKDMTVEQRLANLEAVALNDNH